MAASTVGLSTALLAVTGAASATTIPSWSASGPGTTSAVPAGICWVEWTVDGGGGGADAGATDGSEGGEVYLTLPVSAGDTFTLYPGTAGADALGGGAHGTNGYTADTTTAGTDGDGISGGGGGAASVVTKGTSVYLLAFGGDGAGTNAGAGGGNGTNVSAIASDDFDAAATGSLGDGAITGDGIPCAPKAPYLNSADGDDGSLELDFVDQSTDAGDVPAVGYEWTHDNGATWAPLTTHVNGGRTIATVTGLTNGTTYTVAVRAVGGTNTIPSEASNSVTGTPVRKAGVPTNVQATVAPGAIHISWAPPAGETDIVGYEAWAVPGTGGQQSSTPVECPTLDANARSCTVTVTPGQQYTVGVRGDNGNGGAAVFVVTDTVPAPATVPAGSGSLSTPSGAVGGLAQGSSVTLTGSGYAPNSTVSVYIYSTPTLLGTAVTDGTGSFSKAFTIPATLAPGSHHLVSAGLDPSGNLRYLTTAVTVAQAKGTLAWTGFETLPVLGAGVLAVALGVGLIVVARRRRIA